MTPTEQARDIASELANEVRANPWITGGGCSFNRYVERIAQALTAAYESGLEDAAKKLDAASVHQAETDKHPAWDRSRVDAEPCEEHGHVYHSYPGYAAHVVSQMATVIRALKKGGNDERTR